MSMFSNTWKYFFGETCNRPKPNVDLESKPDLNTNLLSNDTSNNPIAIDKPVIQHKVFFIDIPDDIHKEEIKVEQQEIVDHSEEPKVEQQEIVDHSEEPKVEQQEIVEPIVEQEEIVEPIVEQQEIIEPIVEPIVEKEEIVDHNEEPIVEPIVEKEEIVES
jgi:hypothetical protein